MMPVSAPIRSRFHVSYADWSAGIPDAAVW